MSFIVLIPTIKPYDLQYVRVKPVAPTMINTNSYILYLNKVEFSLIGHIFRTSFGK